MPPKRGETSKGPPASAPGLKKSRESEIVVQKPPTNPSKATDPSPAASNAEASSATKNPTTNVDPHLEAKQLLLDILQQLQTIHDDASKTRTQTITIQKATFEAIGNGIKHAYEHLKQPCISAVDKTNPSSVENTILDTLAQIQGSITTLETKYSDIEAKITDVPKTYAEIIKSTSSKESKIEQQTQRRKQRQILHKEREKYGVILSLKDMSMDKQQSILTMPAKTIAERCQQAINRLYINTSDSPRIIGVSKLAKCFRLQFETEEEASTIRKLDHTKEDIWSTIFEGLKIHEPMHGIVVNGIPIADLDTTMMDNKEIIERLETQNNMKPGTIVKITPLRRRKNRTPDGVKVHHSIIAYMNNQHTANKCITNGFYVDYLHYTSVEKFAPQYQIMQCFNCCDYGHQAINCKRHSRCGKCGERHNTRECKSTNVHCFQCKGSHEAWHPQCPARIAEKDRLEELIGSNFCFFD